MMEAARAARIVQRAEIAGARRQKITDHLRTHWPVALTHREVARVTGVPYSSARTACRILVEAGVLEAENVYGGTYYRAVRSQE